MKNFDLGISYVWEFDEDFLNLLERKLQFSGLFTFRITSYNILEVTEKVLSKKLSFNFYLDRASDVDEDFELLARILTKRKTKIINDYKKTEQAIDKASMHLEFISAGLNVPHSIILPPQSEKENIYISLDDLAILGRPFIIKPCNTTGGGIGVVTGAETLKEVIEERITNYNDKYLLQQKIYPTILDGKRSWFRCFWALGEAIPTWWNDQSHIYMAITENELEKFNLNELIIITKKIAKISELDFFSTEIVLNDTNKFIVIDYVNDQCDMRLKSKHTDGVPDSIVDRIIDNLGKKIKKYKKQTGIN